MITCSRPVRALLTLGLALLIFAAPVYAAAATYYVSTTTGSDTSGDGSSGSPFQTIQTGISASSSGDTVIVEDGMYTGAGNVDLDFGGNNITVQSQNGPATTIIDCGGGSAGPHRGFYFHTNETNAIVSGLTIQNGSESSNGGGVDVESGSSVALLDCTITGNTGGGIYIAAGGFVGGIYIASGSLSLGNCAVTGNTGVGIYNEGFAFPQSCTITGNNGGGVYNSSSGTLNLYYSTVSGNNAFSGGGGVYNDGSAYLFSSTVSGNFANYGAGIYNDTDGNAELYNSTVNGNTTVYNGEGGGIYNASQNLTLYNCVISGNSSGEGAALQNYPGSVLMTNCTLTGNKGFYGNSGIGNGGTVQLLNDILYGDANGANPGGEITTSGTGASVTASYCDIQGGYSGTRNINADPKFVSGADPYDLHLQFNSPCAGAGTANGATPYDKDNVPRGNPPTIGAYEGQKDVTAQIMVHRGGYVRTPRSTTFSQTVTLTNGDRTAIAGPLSLVLDHLTSGVTLTNATGTTTSATGMAGSPYVNTVAGLAAGASVTVKLIFNDPSGATIQYQSRVLAGPGSR